MRCNRLLCSLTLLAGIFISGTALADHHGHGGLGLGFYFGGPYLYPYYPPHYYYHYPYYPPVVVVPQQAPVYIEQTPQQAAPQTSVIQPSGYWYHCDKPDGYYPYIKECPGGWQKVVPTPPPQ